MSASTDANAAALLQLDADVKLLAAAFQAAAADKQAAVDQFADQNTASLNSIDAEVKAALPSA